MGAPTRFTSGFTQDYPFQPLGQIGQQNPMFYATYHDEFIGYLPGRYVITTTSAGTVAQTAGAFGRLLFTTNATTPLATDIASLQVDAAAFSLASNYKCAYFTRFQVSDVTNSAFNVGLIQTSTTPFTVTDGIYFGKASGSAVVTLYSVSASVVTGSVVVPVTLANATDIDLAFLYDGKGNILAYTGYPLVGKVPVQSSAVLGPTASMIPTSFTSTVLTPTLAIQSGTASSKTMNVDFQYAARER